jgi:hypothetical protein
VSGLLLVAGVALILLHSRAEGDTAGAVTYLAVGALAFIVSVAALHTAPHGLRLP